MRRASRVSCVLVLVGACLVSACRRMHQEQPPSPAPAPDSVLERVRALPRGASKRELQARLSGIGERIERAPRRELGSIEKGLSVLREQGHIVAALDGFYKGLADADYGRRLLGVKLLGAVRREEALPVLLSIVKQGPARIARLPKKDARARLNEEVICKRATRGVAYLRTKEADKAVLEIMTQHPLREVRIEAIGAYAWNHDYSRQAIATLNRRLPPQMRRWILLPRFVQRMNPATFDAQVRDWRRRWATEPDPDSPIRVDDIQRTRQGSAPLAMAKGGEP